MPVIPHDHRSARSLHHVALVAFDQAQQLDIAGPADVFAMANAFSDGPQYRVVCVSSQGGLVSLASGLRIDTAAIRAVSASKIDTLIVAGGNLDGLVRAVTDAALKAWVGRAAAQVQRLASVCTGAFALAEWGLLSGARATTHWSAAPTLQRRYPAVSVEPEALYVQDGKVWTSGGVTSGIDMCLAMVEADHGRLLAAQVGRQLVLSARRVGNQAQYSPELRAQAGRYAELADWLRQHLHGRWGIAELAERAGESERSFCRRFAQVVGMTPAAYVEAVRLGVARRHLESGANAKAAARAAGFTSDAHLARAFRRRFDMSPMEYQRAHGAGV